ncbi:hypothetical protein HU200_052113 [Digitaria exilis]|uniref:Uncharacterized protein n=1 Tax=Digitaria exilis TaxID=1010633 RepID=A0A835ASG6_9POAL|nr:hypothetical protein HU200_052113 [Digitaria exilis]
MPPRAIRGHPTAPGRPDLGFPTQAQTVSGGGCPADGRAFGRMSDRKGDAKAEVISHRQRRRLLFSKTDDVKGLISRRQQDEDVKGCEGFDFASAGKMEVEGSKVGQTEEPKSEVPLTSSEKDGEAKLKLEEGDSFITKKPKPEVPPRKMELDKCGAMTGTDDADDDALKLELIGPDDQPHWMAVKEFRCYWNNRWSGYYGSFEDTSEFLH